MQRHFTTLPPLALYIHIPWCVRKCPYCDFNSHEQRDDELPELDYVDALLADLEQELPLIWGRSISSVFIGGGTPSLFSAAALDRLLSGVRALTGLAADTEITLEANPGTVEQARFAEYRAIGINRLSIGIQSFADQQLQALGRIHSGRDSAHAVSVARTAGFDNLNLDLMYGLPQQSPDAALADLQQAIDHAPTHLSYYQLTLEPNTRFHKYPPELPAAETLWQMQDTAFDLLRTHGFRRYEVSAFAQAGRECVHNTNYWLFGDYVGIGAGAHGKISRADTGTITRRSKQRQPKRYLETATTAAVLATEHVVPLEDTLLEFMMNALRLCDGFPAALYDSHTGDHLFRYGTIIDTAVTDGLLVQSQGRVRASTRGLDMLNSLLERFMLHDQGVGDQQQPGPDAVDGTDGQARKPVAGSYPVIPLLRK